MSGYLFDTGIVTAMGDDDSSEFITLAVLYKMNMSTVHYVVWLMNSSKIYFVLIFVYEF